MQEPVVEALVVAQVKPLLLQGPLHVPVRLGHEQHVGKLALHAPDQRRPVILGGGRAGPLAPRAGEDLVGHQHRHVAAHSVALPPDLQHGLRHRVAQDGGERVELHDIRPRREIGIAPAGRDCRVKCDERLGLLSEILLGADDQAFGALAGPGVVRSHVVGHVVKDQAQAAGGELAASRGQPIRPAEALVDHIVAHAVGRADHVLWAQVGERGMERRVKARVGQSDPQTLGTAFPHPHQPHGVHGQGGQRIPLRRRHLAELERPPGGATKPLEPWGGVELVQSESGRQSHGGP